MGEDGAAVDGAAVDEGFERDPIDTLTAAQCVYLLSLVDHSGTICPLLALHATLREALLVDLALTARLGCTEGAVKNNSTWDESREL